MADILLFNPYYSQRKEYYSFYTPAPPLGLMYLASYLRKHKVESKIFELGVFEMEDVKMQKDRVRFGVSDKEIREILKKEKPKIVGITSMYSIYYRDVMEIAKTIKKFDKKIKVIIGGNHPSSYYKYVLKDRDIDLVVIGEGEVTFLELCRAILAGKKNFADIKGIAYYKNRKVVTTTPRPLIEDLDEVPFPARDMIDLAKYSELAKNSPYIMRHPISTIVTSRGCPQKCVYCTVKAVWGRTWRGRSANNVVDEIEELVNNYGIRELAFLDDTASLDKRRWGEICDELVRRKLNIKWMTPNGIAHWTLDKKLVKKMYKAGCYRITFGIESGNPETRRFLGKPFALKQARDLIEYANKLGMWTICTNIIGFPYEKMDSIRDTIEYAKHCGTDFAAFFLLIPQPTSDVYQYFRKENLLNLDRYLEDLSINGDEFEKVNYILNETGCDTVYFKKEELRELQKNAYREFITHRALSYLTNPIKIIHKIHSLEDLRYVTRLLAQGLKIVARTLNPLNLKSSDYLYQKKSLLTVR